jgi:hypothetical protein
LNKGNRERLPELMERTKPILLAILPPVLGYAPEDMHTQILINLLDRLVKSFAVELSLLEK